MNKNLVEEIKKSVGQSLLFSDEQINELEEISGDSLMESLEKNPLEDRFNDPDIVSNFAQSFTFYIASTFIIGVPFQVWRVTCKENFKKYKDYAKLIDGSITDAIIDLTIDKIICLISKWFPKK